MLTQLTYIFTGRTVLTYVPDRHKEDVSRHRGPDATTARIREDRLLSLAYLLPSGSLTEWHIPERLLHLHLLVFEQAFC